nr:hypothetical protein CFP56_58775 [Quercus suber]
MVVGETATTMAHLLRDGQLCGSSSSFAVNCMASGQTSDASVADDSEHVGSCTAAPDVQVRPWYEARAKSQSSPVAIKPVMGPCSVDTEADVPA